MAVDASALDALKALPYFKPLGDPDLKRLARTLVERAFEKDEMILLEGEPCQGLHLLRAGAVKIFKLSDEGREQILRYMRAGDSFNEVAVFDGGPNPANAAATAASVIWIVPRNVIIDLIKQNPLVALAVIQNLGARMRHMVALVEDLSLRQVSARLARLLLATALEHAPPMTQQEMAAQLGTVREMIGRSLRQLEAKGLIKIERGRVIILDRAGLEKLV